MHAGAHVAQPPTAKRTCADEGSFLAIQNQAKGIIEAISLKNIVVLAEQAIIGLCHIPKLQGRFADGLNFGKQMLEIMRH